MQSCWQDGVLDHLIILPRADFGQTSLYVFLLMENGTSFLELRSSPFILDLINWSVKLLRKCCASGIYLHRYSFRNAIQFPQKHGLISLYSALLIVLKFLVAFIAYSPSLQRHSCIKKGTKQTYR